MLYLHRLATTVEIGGYWSGLSGWGGPSSISMMCLTWSEAGVYQLLIGGTPVCSGTIRHCLAMAGRLALFFPDLV